MSCLFSPPHPVTQPRSPGWDFFFHSRRQLLANATIAASRVCHASACGPHGAQRLASTCMCGVVVSAQASPSEGGAPLPF
jgi:hypothetical protein